MFEKFRAALTAKMPVGSFARDVIILMTGTAFAQFLMILVAPILTRLYSPQDFGILALYTSILGILSIVACWSYEIAIVLPAKDEDAANLLALSVLVCLGMSVVSLIGAALLGTWLARMLSAPALSNWLWFMPLSLVAAGLFQAFNYWSTRRKHFKRLAKRTITQSIVTSAVQVGAVQIPGSGAGGLIVGNIIGQLAATARLAWHIKQDEGSCLRSYIKLEAMKRVALEYRRYPLYGSWSGFLFTAATLIPNFMLGYFFSPAIVGLYSLSQRILFLPLDLVGNAIFRVFLPQAVLLNRKGKLISFTITIYHQLVDLTIAPLLIIAMIGPVLFNVVFGSEWIIAGEYTRWLCIWAIFRFVTSPITGLYDVFGKQKQELALNSCMFILRFIALLVGGKMGDPLLTVALFAAVSAMMYAIIGLYLFHLCHISYKEFFVPLIVSLFKALPYLAPVLLALIFSTNQILIIVAALLVGIIFLLQQQKVFINIRNAEYGD